MRFTPDLSKAVPRLVPGKYEAEFTKVEEHNSKKGNPCIKTHYKICHGPFARHIVPVITPLTGKGASFFVDLARCFDPSYIDGEFDLSAHVGKKVLLDVTDVRGINGERSYLKIFPRELFQNDPVAESVGASTAETPTE